MNGNHFSGNIEVAFRNAMQSAGLEFDGPVIADGALHRELEAQP
jgi:hypothetical protein